jgi:hypothetical protein
MKRLLAFAAAVTAGLVFASIAAAYPTPRLSTLIDGQKYCPTGPTVVYVTQTVVDDVDTAPLAGFWASESYSRVIQVVKTGPRSYCMGTNYSGTFTAWGGRSPGGTGWLAAGTTGTVGGGYKSTVFTADWVPTAPTSGVIPTADFDCYTGTCANFQDWLSLYFQNVRGFNSDRWQFIYRTPAAPYSGWYNTYVGDWGDVTG